MCHKPKWGIILVLCLPLYLWSLTGCMADRLNPVTNLSPSPSAIKTSVVNLLVPSDTPAAPTVHNWTPVLTPKIEISPIIDTSSPTPTVISTPVKNLGAVPLSKGMLNRNDYLALDDSSLKFLVSSDVDNTYFKNGAATITDTSAELAPICLIECTKQVWATKSEKAIGLGGSQVILNSKIVIAMFRLKDANGARITARNIYHGFAPYEDEYGDNEYRLVDAPIKNTSIGIGIQNNRLAVVLTTSVGPITVWVMNYPHQLSDFAQPEIDLAIYFANLQIKKLKENDIVP